MQTEPKDDWVNSQPGWQWSESRQELRPLPEQDDAVKTPETPRWELVDNGRFFAPDGTEVFALRTVLWHLNHLEGALREAEAELASFEAYHFGSDDGETVVYLHDHPHDAAAKEVLLKLFAAANAKVEAEAKAALADGMASWLLSWDGPLMSYADEWLRSYTDALQQPKAGT